MIGKRSTAKTPFVKEIADEIARLFKSGVKLKVIFDYIQKFDDAPRSYKAMMTTYKGVVAEARATIQAEMGEIVMAAAREGDWSAARFYLQTKAGWNDKIIIEDDGDDEGSEETGAIDELIALLNVEDDKE
jgi:hypothetical protein